MTEGTSNVSVKEEFQEVISDWLDYHFADLQPWEEEELIEQEIWDNLWSRLKARGIKIWLK